MEAGLLRVAANADLGGLGSVEGPATGYNWTRPSLLPVLLPWMMILGLLTLKPNRTGQAWLIWVPVALLCGVAGLVTTFFPEEAPSALADLIAGSVTALAFGLGAVWLLIPYLGLKHRFVSFLGCLLVLGFVTGLAWVLREGFEGGIEQAAKGILPFVATGVISVALVLSGLACRGRYQASRLSVLLLCGLAVTWLLLFMPFAVFGMVSGQGGDFGTMMVASVGVVTLLSFTVVLPFLLLSFAAGLYRDRLKAFLRLGAEAPPLISSEPPPVQAVAN